MMFIILYMKLLSRSCCIAVYVKNFPFKLKKKFLNFCRILNDFSNIIIGNYCYAFQKSKSATINSNFFFS